MKIHTTLLKQTCAGLIDFLTAKIETVTNDTVHPASRRNQEQTVADPDGQTTKKIGYCLDCLPPPCMDAVAIDVMLSVLNLDFFTITYPLYAHFILSIQ